VIPQGLHNFGAHMGRAEVADEVVGPNFTELWISLDPDVDYAGTVAKIQGGVDGYPGLYRDVLTYLKERIKEVLTGTSASIVVRVYGPDLDVLREKGQEIAADQWGTVAVGDQMAFRAVFAPIRGIRARLGPPKTARTEQLSIAAADQLASTRAASRRARSRRSPCLGMIVRLMIQRRLYRRSFRLCWMAGLVRSLL